jgi:sugar transferase (PEP-CTERM/EpsH1 system associated)
VLLSRVPYPLEKGDKLRAYHLVRRLAQRHEVHLCCLSDQRIAPEHLDHLRGICHQLEVIPIPFWRISAKLIGAAFSRMPFQVAYFRHGFAQRRVDRIIERFRPDHVLCQLVRTTEYVRHRYELPKTIDFMDTLSKGTERRIATAPLWLRPMWRMETRRLIHYENLMFDLFDHRVIISSQDRDYLYHPGREHMSVIANGVDTTHFQPMPGEPKYDLLFTGNMNYPPNIDSAVFLARKVLPLVRRSHPRTTLLISGVDPSPEVRELASRDPLITVTGWVRDIRESYASARVFTAPMRIGTGLQNKLLEAMAMGRPCVTTELANNPIGARSGEEILIGNEAGEHAAHIVHLLDNVAECERIAANGLRFVRQHFDWESAADQLDALITCGTGIPSGPHEPA